MTPWLSGSEKPATVPAMPHSTVHRGRALHQALPNPSLLRGPTSPLPGSEDRKINVLVSLTVAIRTSIDRVPWSALVIPAAQAEAGSTGGD